jgi:hypothetical protein
MRAAPPAQSSSRWATDASALEEIDCPASSQTLNQPKCWPPELQSVVAIVPATATPRTVSTVMHVAGRPAVELSVQAPASPAVTGRTRAR